VTRFAACAGLIVILALVSAVYPQTPAAPDTFALYASAGPELTHYELAAAAATLTKRASVLLPQDVQYAWPHPTRRVLYVAWSNGVDGHDHGVTAFSIDSASGALRRYGEPTHLPARPIHLSVDMTGTHLLIAYNAPSSATVHRLAPDGTIGMQVAAPARLDAGIYAHQIRVDPSNTFAILVARGNGPANGQPEDPGALKVLGYDNGTLTNRASVAPGGGLDFQPRHLDFHPSKPWVFVSLERQNKLQVYRKLPDGILSAPLFTKDSLAAPDHVVTGQAAGTVHVHPNGRFVYQANRANGTTPFKGKAVFAGGENTIAVYAIDQDTGEPTRIQNIDTRGIRPRTFALDPTARLLVAANQEPLLVRDGDLVRTVPASLSVFRVGADGKLEFVRKYDVAATEIRSMLWMGIVPVR
jgi:6-phosphogluconolactonase (cycloisomerase 2 family)